MYGIWYDHKLAIRSYPQQNPPRTVRIMRKQQAKHQPQGALTVQPQWLMPKTTEHSQNMIMSCTKNTADEGNKASWQKKIKEIATDRELNEPLTKISKTIQTRSNL